MKKRICILICAALVLALAATVFAAGAATMTLTPSASAPAHGEEFTVTVSFTEVANCKSAGIVVAYDTAALELVSGECLVNAFMSDFDPADGSGVLAFSSPTTLSGDVFRFTLRVKESANVAEDAIISVRPSIKDADGTVECQTANLALDVTCSHSYGDWNRLNEDQHGKSCSKCGDVVKEDHSWDEGNVEIEADCSKGGLVIYTCTGCGATKEVTTERLDHVYDSSCDTECNNGCGTTREANHEYSAEWSSDGENHWHACGVCGDKGELQPHEPGDPATEWSAQTCTVCDHVLQSALGHTHNYGAEWIFDDHGHWLECPGCEELKDYADHVYDNTCDTECNVCGRKRQIEHTLDANWWFDGNGHWRECTVCGEKTPTESHIPGPEATESAAQTCTECGYELAPMLGHTHDYGDGYQYDENSHWKQCACGNKDGRENHTWNEGTVIKAPTADAAGEKLYLCTACGAEKRESIPPQAGTDPTTPTVPSGKEPNPVPAGFHWWILVAIGGGLVLGFVIFMLVGAIIGQRKKGKYSR